MSEVTALIAEIKSKGLLRAGDKLEELYAVAARIQADNSELKAQRDALAAENVGMDKFVDSLLSIAWQGGSADGADIQELALKQGLIRQESYCADTHESLVEDPGNFEEGDDVYFRVETPATATYLNSVRAEAVESFAHHQRVIADALPGHESQRSHRITASRAEDFANQLRAGKDGE